MCRGVPGDREAPGGEKGAEEADGASCSGQRALHQMGGRALAALRKSRERRMVERALSKSEVLPGAPPIYVSPHKVGPDSWS